MVIGICVAYLAVVIAVLLANNYIHTPSNGHYYMCDELDNG